MKIVGFDAPENCAGGCSGEQGGLVGREHPDLLGAILTPGGATTAQADCRSLPLLNRDFGFGFRPHNCVKIRQSQNLLRAELRAISGSATPHIFAAKRSENL